MFYVLALASALCWGAADFLGGITSRRAHILTIVLLSQAAGLVLMAIFLPVLPAAVPRPGDWFWGSAAGLTGGIGVALLYRGLAVGVMAVVAPITAVCAVIVPVLIAVALGERPGGQAIAGIVLALVAIALVSQQDTSATDAGTARKGIGLALASGVALGLFFFTLARASADAGLWPLLAARLTSVIFFAALALYSRPSFRLAPRTAATAICGGVIDMLANVLYLLAAQRGPLTLVVTLSSLYPASTVMLARLVLGERLRPRQWLGVASALAAIVIIVRAR